MFVRKFLAPVALALVLVLTGCFGGDGEHKSAQANEISFPSTELGHQASWIVSQVNSEKGISIKDLESRLSEKITKQMSAEELGAALDSDVTPDGPFTLVSFDEKDSHALAGLKNDSGEIFQMSITIDPSDGKIDGVYFKAK